MYFYVVFAFDCAKALFSFSMYICISPFFNQLISALVPKPYSLISSVSHSSKSSLFKPKCHLQTNGKALQECSPVRLRKPFREDLHAELPVKSWRSLSGNFQSHIRNLKWKEHQGDGDRSFNTTFVLNRTDAPCSKICRR